MKKLLALLIISCMLMTTLASCGLWGWGGKPCTEHVDADGNHICDKCEEELEDHVPPSLKPCDEHKDEDGDLKCDVCGESCAEIPPECGQQKDEDGDGKCDICGADIRDPQPPVCAEHKDEDGDYKCDVCSYVMFEDVEYELNISDLEPGVRGSDDINGKFTIVSGTEVRNRTKTYEGIEYNKSVKIGGNANKILVDVPGPGTLKFIVQNGSSGADMQYIKVTAPDGTVHDIEFPGNSQSSPLVMIELPVTEGVWTIGRGKNGGTQDIFYLHLACTVAVAPENGFELVTPGNTDLLVGDTLTTDGVRLNATFENGKTEMLNNSEVTFDTSKVDMSKSGVYDVTVSYKDYAPITYQVSVFAPESITLGFDAIEKLANNSAAGNGVYFNHSFKELYFLGEELDTKGLSVIVVAKCGERSLEFKVNDYTIEGFNSAEEGEQTLTITANGVSATTTVHVCNVDITPDADGVVKALVDPAYLGLRGHLSGPYHVFSTIQQALDFIAHVEPATQKAIYIAPGQYNEKLEITVPNLKIEGVGEKPEDVVIEWDSLYGLVDAGGFTHTTDSTATVAIRDNAVNVEIKNVTISNYWNTQERMDAAGLAIERGLALLVQSDRFIMTDSRLLGIQDTLELFTGRQYFENVFISGYTDFIFGTNNTTYFKNCTIHVIDTVKDDQGTAGYLTAFKGSNKGADDAIVYGAIFDGCKFTADEGVGGTEEKPAKTAIGRPWGAYAAVAIINSEIGGHISTAGYSTSKNERYVSMNAKPTDATVQFVEYNNTGAGAITEAVAGMRMLTAEEAALYADFATIYGTINGKVSYLDSWDPTSDEVIVDDRDYYYFNGGSSATGNSHTFDTTTTIASGSTLEWDGLLISAENGKVAWNSNANALNMKAGAFIKFTVAAGTTVTVETYPNYNYFTLNGVGTASANMLSQYYAEETEVVLLSTGDLYLYSIIIDPNSEAPAAPELNEIKVSGLNVNYTVGTEFSLEGLVVNAYFSDNSVIPVTGYTVDSSAVNINAEGEYEIVISYEGKSVTVKVTYEDPNAGPEISKNTVLDFTTPDGLEAVKNNPKVTMTGSIRHNGGEIQIKGTISFQVKAGTVVTVIPYANSSYASYKIYAEGEESTLVYNDMQSVMFFEDCTVVYEGLDNNYLCSIIIECPLGEGKYVFGGSSVEGDVTGILESIPGMSITGTCKTHSGGAQLGADSQIIFIAPALATVTVQGYDKSYGQLLVYVDGVPVEMNANAQYVFTPTYPVTVVIEALNVGTEEAPAYNKSYITYIDLNLPKFIEEDLTINFGSAGNYKDSVIDFSGITIGDNGGNNSQIKNGSFSFAVKAGAKVTVHGYSGYTSYNFSDGDVVFEGITDEYFTYEAGSDCVITISHTTGNNYFYSIGVEYPVVFAESTTIDLSATGANIQGTTGKYEGLSIDATNGKFADNNGGWVQVNTGTIVTLNVLAGAEVSVRAYSSEDNFDIVIAGGVCTITCTANDYLKAISINYPIVYSENTTIDLSATGANIQAGTGVYEGLSIDAANGKFADNNGGWVQVNTGTIITLNVAEGATVTVSAYSSADNFSIVIADGVCTITCVGNDYLNGITVSF